MRVAVIVSTFPPYRGGMGKVAEREACFFALSGHEVTVFVPRGASARVVNDESPYRIRELGGMFSIGNATVLPALLLVLRGFDVVHLHLPFFGGAVFACLGARLAAARFTVTYHMDAVAHGWRGWVFHFLLHLTLPFILASAERIRVSSFDYANTSPYLTATLRRAPKKFIEIPFALPVLTTGRASIGDRTALVMTEDPFFLFVGGMDRAHEFKNIPLLLRAFALAAERLPNVWLALIGDGELRETYEVLAAREGIGKRTRFLGDVSDGVLIQLLSNALALVLPSASRAEAFGLVALQALSVGTPVIAADIPGVRTVVTAAVGRCVPPNDPLALALALQEMFGSDKRRYLEPTRRMMAEKYSDDIIDVQLRKFL